jgi:hypothetical protein
MTWLGGIAAAGAAIAFSSTTATALTMQECSAKYKAAQTAGTLNGMKWNDFRKAECGSGATPAAAASGPAAPAVATKPAETAPKPTPKSAATSAPAAAGNAVYPTTVSSKYSSESAGKARMHTCLDQYKANKTSDGNGGLKWIEKGGGYYSECNKRLKG